MKQLGESFIRRSLNKYYTFKYQLRQRRSKRKITNICIIYYISNYNAEKYNQWEDGFTKSVELLEESYKIDKINLFDLKPTADELNCYDLVIAKSCWNWIVDRYLQQLRGLKVKRGIAVSCSIPPPIKNAFFYDVIWYETYWYKKEVSFHPNHHQAFGINSDVFKPKINNKDIDVLSIGTITSYKRFEKLNNIEGEKKIIVGDTTALDYEEQKKLIDPNIEIFNYVSQQDLAEMINRSKLVYLPCELQGGGERALLEALACGVNVKVENDNPKLLSLLTDNPFITKFDYYFGLKRGIESLEKLVISANRIESKGKLKCGINSFFNTNFRVKGSQKVTIGSYCSFGENVTFLTENHDINYAATQGYLYRKNFESAHPGELNTIPNIERTKGQIFIGNDVWIGDDVKVFSGVTIGDGACIAAGSIVTKDVSPYCVAGGIPARVLKKRFCEEIVCFLLELQWWLWTDARIQRNRRFFEANLNSLSVNEVKELIEE